MLSAPPPKDQDQEPQALGVPDGHPLAEVQFSVKSCFKVILGQKVSHFLNSQLYYSFVMPYQYLKPNMPLHALKEELPKIYLK